MSRRLLALASLLALLPFAFDTAQAASAAGVVDIPVHFSVVNRNRTLVPCAGDRTVTSIAGHLVGPRAALRTGTADAAMLYLHGLGFTGDYWRFDAVKGYDTATDLARRGHVSVVIDRLGHGDSPLANGNRTCIGAQADMAHQIVLALKTGAYQRDDHQAAAAFARVGLAGHSFGVATAELAAWTFGDVDALIVMNWMDSGVTPFALRTLTASNLACATASDGYAPFGRTDADYRRAMFHAADPAVVEAATAARVDDPCGDLVSTTPGLAANEVGIGLITAPVLLACGAFDALFPSRACGLQAARYFASQDVTWIELADAGHAALLERNAAVTRKVLADWLSAKGF